jgi:hypothetical protein
VLPAHGKILFLMPATFPILRFPSIGLGGAISFLGCTVGYRYHFQSIYCTLYYGNLVEISYVVTFSTFSKSKTSKA